MSESSLHHFLLVKLFLFLFYHVYREPKTLLMIHSVVSQNAHRETRHAKTLRLLVDSSSYMMDLREVRSLCMIIRCLDLHANSVVVIVLLC